MKKLVVRTQVRAGETNTQIQDLVASAQRSSTLQTLVRQMQSLQGDTVQSIQAML